MSKILFNDRMSIKTVDETETKSYVCEFHQNFVTAAQNAHDKYDWKHSGEGAIFRGDTDVENATPTKNIAYFNSLKFLSENEIIYSVTVDEISCVMRKDLSTDKDNEGHIVHSREYVYNGASPNKNGTAFVSCLKTNEVNSHLAIFNLSDNDYYTVTDGDSCDFDATYSRADNDYVLFATKGAGRNKQGEFVKYSQSSIYRYDTLNGDVEELLCKKDYSLVKPKDDENGNLYYISKPEDGDKRSVWGILLDIILIPWHLLVAIYRFLEAFTLIFTGRKFIKDGSDPVKTKDRNDGKILIEGNLINAEKEYKRNLRHKDAFAGYAPHSWELIKKAKDGTETVMAKGVINYCISPAGEIYFTNGKHVVKITADGKREKIADTSLCTEIDAY